MPLMCGGWFPVDYMETLCLPRASDFSHQSRPSILKADIKESHPRQPRVDRQGNTRLTTRNIGTQVLAIQIDTDARARSGSSQSTSAHHAKPTCARSAPGCVRHLSGIHILHLKGPTLGRCDTFFLSNSKRKMRRMLSSPHRGCNFKSEQHV